MKFLFKKLKGYLDNYQLSYPPPVPKFDNDGKWVNAMLPRLMKDPQLWNKPQYIYGCLQSAALAKVLGLPAIAFVEFGVAGGNGLRVMDKLAVLLSKELGIKIDVLGFDSGQGMPKPTDYRDLPYLFNEGEYSMNFVKLQNDLKVAKLVIGQLSETLPFKPASPIAFISFDLDYYTSTVQAFEIFKADLLPRTLCYFDDVFYRGYCEYNGPLLAIREYNDSHEQKLGKVNGLRYFLSVKKDWAWPDAIYWHHDFKHPLYNQREMYAVTI